MRSEIDQIADASSHWLLDLVEQRRPLKPYIWGSVAILGLFDWLTGYELNFQSFYLLPIFLGGFGYGWRLAAQITFWVIAFAIASGIIQGHHFSTQFLFYFDIFNRLLAYSGFVFIIEQLRRAILMQIRISDLDSLTGLLNRHGFIKILSMELMRSKRGGGSFGLLFLDCDNFKGVNDRHGHAEGDLLLRNVATVLRSQLRGIDVIGRFGGDEFVVLLPGSTETSATHVAEKLRSFLLLAMERQDWPVTFSIGVHVSGADDHESLNPDAMLAKADMAMYAAKKGGKDRVVAF